MRFFGILSLTNRSRVSPQAVQSAQPTTAVATRCGPDDSPARFDSWAATIFDGIARSSLGAFKASQAVLAVPTSRDGATVSFTSQHNLLGAMSAGTNGRPNSTKKGLNMSKHCFEGAHLETEKGYGISKAESRLLRRELQAMGFAFLKKSLITDFVIPTRGETTRRMRIENIKKAADGAKGIYCIRCFKNHPIKGKRGKHVRMEDEKNVKPRKALTFILTMIGELGAPIPYYSKKRRLYRGVYEGYEMTISLDHAKGIGKFSGYYMEIETILPLDSKEEKVAEVIAIIEKLARVLLGERRKAKISYRKMLMKTWADGEVRKNKLPKVKRKKLRKAKGNYKKLLKKVAKA